MSNTATPTAPAVTEIHLNMILLSIRCFLRLANLQPQPGGKGWAPRAKPRRIRATYTRPHGVRHLISAYDVGADRLYGHIKKRKDRARTSWSSPGTSARSTQPRRACTCLLHGGFPFAATFAFLDGTHANAHTTVPCPKYHRPGH